MQRFYWLVEGAIAGCSLPGRTRETLEDDFRWLQEQGIEAILTLTESPIDEDAARQAGIDVLHIPVPDMTAPLPAQIDAALRYIDMHRAADRPVVVHCLMGQGRTGTILAAYLIRGGATAEEAIDRLRTICPGAIESPEQREALARYAERRDWVL